MTSEATGSVGTHLAALNAELADAARAAGRDPAGVRLLAAAKQQPADTIRAALTAGHRLFGENKVQEGQHKWPELRTAWPDSELHLIGPLQTNKAGDAVTTFDVIQSLDRERLARKLSQAMARTGANPACLVQVNTGEEPQKAGIVPGELDDFLTLCRDELGLTVSGLMAIPPVDENPAPHFALLAEAAARHGLRELSMGMSGDYVTAVHFGATIVRLGTAVFGPRPG